MELSWSVVGLEILNFGVLVALLSRLLLTPVRKVLQARRTALEAQDLETRARETAAAALQARCEAELARMDEIARDRVAEVLGGAEQRAATIIDGARASARERIDEAEREVATIVGRAVEAVRHDLFRLAVEAARRVIADTDGGGVALAFARRAAHRLAQSAPRDRLDTLHVATSDDVDPARVEAVLRDVLGPGPQIAFEIDPTLTAGVRLRAGDLEVEASAGHSLEAWYREAQAST